MIADEAVFAFHRSVQGKRTFLDRMHIVFHLIKCPFYYLAAIGLVNGATPHIVSNFLLKYADFSLLLPINVTEVSSDSAA